MTRCGTLQGRRKRPAVFLAALVAIGPAAVVAQASEAPPVVLVHGAWGGGWDWKPVADELEARGHESFRATLTGLGERRHLASADIGLDVHIQDVVNLIEWERLDDVVLVGHSYGGMVVTGVAERIPDRIGRLVYVDALLPFDGECARSTQSEDPSACDGWDAPENGFVQYQDGLLVPRWVGKQAVPPHDVPHPVRTFLDRLDLSGSPGAGRPASYVITREVSGGEDAFDWAAKRARGLGWRVSELVADHNPQRSHVEELVDLLLSPP